ncbi:rhodanese-like domain-containing protein [Rhizobium sp. CRIBSB]|nr:rhodanese-like domain-containing protein [Rhizobium sp. CRIBSB]
MIDVREPDEFAAARIEGTIPAPLSEMPAVWNALDLPEGKSIIIQCLSGGRSARVCAFVGPTGPSGQPVFNLTGGIQAWNAAGLPVIFAAD